MILNIKCSNVYSIGEEVVLDFSVDSHAPKNHLYQAVDVDGYRKRVSLINTMIGPNASGKTNVLTVLDLLQHLIVDSLSDNVDLGILYCTPNARHYNDPTSISTKFSVDNRLFEYSFMFNRKQILKEKMVEYKKAKQRFSGTTLFERTWDKKKESYVLKDNVLDITAQELRSNASIVSVAKQLPKKYPFAKKITDFWSDNVILRSTEGSSSFRMMGRNPFSNVMLDKVLDDTKVKKKVYNLLSRYDDVGFREIVRKEIDRFGSSNHDLFYSYSMVHEYGGDQFSIPWGDESSGTKRLVSLLVDISIAMSKSASTIAIDEIEAFLHPDIVESILELFLSKKTNTNNTQIIFSTHHHRILSELDKQQIFLCEKNEDGETEVSRLDECKGVRAGDNYYMKYMSGQFKAKPKIQGMGSI